MAANHVSISTERRKKHRFVLNIDRIPHLTADEKARLKPVTDRYAFRANDYYLSLIDWNDPHDPIRRLVIPDEIELRPWGMLDASKESDVTVRKGVQHKYGEEVTTGFIIEYIDFGEAKIKSSVPVGRTFNGKFDNNRAVILAFNVNWK